MVPEEVSFSRDVYPDSFPEAFEGLSISSSTDKTLLVTVQNNEILNFKIKKTFFNPNAFGSRK